MSDNKPIEISLSVLPDNWENTCAIARAVEDNRLHSIAPADSPMIGPDMLLSCTACALSTSSAKIFSGVTNPVTRHPSVMAASYLCLEELAPQRNILGIATGDSALWSVGLKPARVTELGEYIVAVKALLRGEEAQWRGNRFAASWRSFEPFDLPVYVACTGPRAIHMASQVADGLVLSVGLAPEDLTWADEQIHEACTQVGRNPAELDIWHYSEITFADSAEAAAETTLGTFSHWLTLGGTDGKRIPDEYKPLLLELNNDTEDLQAAYATQGRGRIMVERAKALGVYVMDCVTFVTVTGHRTRSSDKAR